jgi:hypothetical protein
MNFVYYFLCEKYIYFSRYKRNRAISPKVLGVSEIEIKEKEGENKEKELKYLPPIFIEGETLNKFSLRNDYVNCPRYVSRSGATQEGCFVLKINENGEITFKEVRGIYLKINKILDLDSSRKIFWDVNEVFNLSKQINYRDDKEILIKWSNYGFEAYNKYRKGRRLNFEKVGEQGNLKIFKVPFPREGFYANGEIKDSWEEIKEIQIYNHKLIFDNMVKVYKGLHVMPGDGILIFVDREIFVRAESPDHGNNVFSLSPQLGVGFYLFSHPKPRRSID